MIELGFFTEDEVFSESECARLVDALRLSSFRRGRAGTRHLMSHPDVRHVASDKRLLRIAQLVDCVVRRGGIMAMYPLLVHSSGKAQSDSPRRVLHIEYADSLLLATGIQLAVA